MSDKIAQIRARHEAGSPGEVPIAALCQCDADREFLLAEVDRLRSVISTLEIVGKAADDERAKFFAEIKRLHQAHETACQGGELLRDEVKRLQAELDAMRAGFEVAYRAGGQVMTRTYTPSQIADGILAEEFFRDTEFVLAHEIERLRAFEAAHRQLQSDLDTAIRKRDEARAALKPFTNLYLWPDDADPKTLQRVRSGRDWDEAANDQEANEYGIKRGDIRAARKALEAKP